MQLLIATGNPSKLKMFQNLLGDLEDIELLSLSDFETISEPEENGKTVKDNALLKAKYYCEAFNIPTLADDAGFEVEDLGGSPGVMARRWGGELSNSISDEDFLEFFLEKISHIDKERLNACFPFSRCLYFPSGKYSFQNERIGVVLGKKPRRPYKPGWPMSSITYLQDGRHHLDISDDDIIFQERLKKEGLIELIKKTGFTTL